jgi:TRAP-type C4-dicarboxylate transport system permease small subunit
LHGIASLALVAMMLVVVADVTLRFAFNIPLRGAYDMVSAFLLVMVFFGIGPVIAYGREILIDLLDKVVPGAVLRGLRLIAAIGTLAVFLFIGWSMYAPARDAFRYGDRSLELGLPVWTLWAVAFAGFIGIVWASVRALIAAWRTDGTEHDPATGEGDAP